MIVENCGIPQAQETETTIPEMTVQELKQLMDSGKDDFILLDVRNPNEYEIAKIEGAVLIPLGDIESGTGVTKVKE